MYMKPDTGLLINVYLISFYDFNTSYLRLEMFFKICQWLQQFHIFVTSNPFQHMFIVSKIAPWLLYLSSSMLKETSCTFSQTS